MGCWNATCGLTSLPIHWRDKVYVFPIYERNTKDYRDFCYTTSLFSPSLLPFEAEYDDVGGGENCSGIVLDKTIETLRKTLVEKDQGDNPYHDLPVKRESFNTTDDFFSLVHKKRLEIRQGFSTQTNPVFFTMIHKDIVDRLWHEWRFEAYVGHIKKYAGQTYLKDLTYKKISEGLPEFLELLKADGFRGNVDERDTGCLTAMYVHLGSSSYRYWDTFYLNFLLEDLVDAGNEDKALKILELYLKSEMVDSMMGSLRRIWLPVQHQGSQDSNYDNYKFINELVADHIDRTELGNDE